MNTELRRRRRRIGAIGAISVGALLATIATTPAAAHPRAQEAPPVRTIGNEYGTKAPYSPFQDIDDYQDVPSGYEQVLLEHVGRHGSRLLSSKKYDDLLLQLWEIANADGGLTPAGQPLGAVLQQIIAVHDAAGYGSLSGRGALEQQGIAERAVDRSEDFFEDAADDGRAINIVSSGVDRAVESADNFVVGLLDEEDDLEDVVQPQVFDPALLYFHDTDPDYLAYEESEDLATVIEQIETSPLVEPVARDVVERLFTPAFIARIDAGEFDLVDRGKGKTHLQTVTDVALYLYELYVIAPGMSQEAAIDMTPFLPDADAAQLAYLSDAKDFYEKGPAFAGSDVSYRMSHVLVDAFLDAVEGVSTGATTQAADFRFAHAETIIPFAAQLGLPGSRQQQPAGVLYGYDNNEWRGAQVAPMAANVQWEVFRNHTGKVIVRMLYNEQETAFRPGCAPIRAGSAFYAASELSRCLADLR